MLEVQPVLGSMSGFTHTSPREALVRQIALILSQKNPERTWLKTQIDALLEFMLETFQGTPTVQQARRAFKIDLPVNETALAQIPDNKIAIVVVRGLMKRGIKMTESTIWQHFIHRYHDVLLAA